MKKTILIVIDGLGLREQKQGNGFKLANTPTFDMLFSQYPNSIIQASGEFVGLPAGQMGNSEVGHLNIGAGTVVYTGLSLINKAIKDGEFEKNPVFNEIFKDVKDKNTTLHLMGLLSPGGVHSLEDHLFKLLEMAHNYGLKKVSVHPIGDGRDVAPKSIIPSLEKLQALCDEYGYKIATISGRFYGMDRDKMFNRVEVHYEAMIGKAENKFTNVIDYIKKQYDEGISDEFFIPACNKDAEFIKDNDSIIFFNFRPDRARQLAHLFIGSDLYDAKPKHPVHISKFASLMKYEGINTLVAIHEMEVKMPIGKVLELANLSQLRVAETQKYAHVTYFMDGGVDVVFKNSKRIMVPSLKVESYADAPQMSAKEITDELLANCLNYDVTIMNYANPDMVGHTGNLESTIKAVSFLDSQIKRVIDFANKNNITVFITADHGNAEITEDENGNPATKHTKNPVMLICSDKSIKLKDGKLANIAPTILDYINVAKPIEMDEESLIER
ncbi:2,3-bisphosphoglycerate-independent phosphoglycerate mutase [Mycoplasmopsis agalactiae]|uniref:2,3-bisphosphoglycerate-independent phosphoglycerate mutase n=1 Tax=Mycoplasmopsis agalactiae (strain NCTC 10123 / CIP 59.7 / PG2) TaxID=347257 RepID=A5IZD0_MYCAP|nr:2,3-bisphosphoglycerate-independent phosphoglycerate mutase [Mycoplasmopsis agalactiae]MCE6057405.1 2,3-bisphosphoglycerate-independent phosphoglycerate mutase [Mycoplasmopsis agalactiae]MCE6079183.1 2,3-bisphosphoglycerate-independent phosphoglycerate mutase [Mycoplasmopsis agalactiae]MCE6095581.1 2,3-bisphosphoglycerate-independent phosphoglycerate mutase [Mycoplasmopsis agalactiae]MCE6114828.1 2,3-bisphosphoglycerate-independent phosphoglycerate mutase [Mycoplasmopsis agalactiae]NLS34449